jgi:hypothetical protein
VKVSLIIQVTATATRDSHYLPWRHNINRNDPICVASPKVAKASTMVTVACRCHRRYRGHYHTNFCQWKHGLKLDLYSLATLQCNPLVSHKICCQNRRNLSCHIGNKRKFYNYAKMINSDASGYKTSLFL